ncbi:hypothetical protein [Commensalibacter sp. Nvir]
MPIFSDETFACEPMRNGKSVRAASGTVSFNRLFIQSTQAV